jgi:hypothetical protein
MLPWVGIHTLPSTNDSFDGLTQAMVPSRKTSKVRPLKAQRTMLKSEEGKERS